MVRARLTAWIVMIVILMSGAAFCKGAVNVGNMFCPVMGYKINSKTPPTAEYKGKSYNLCCRDCIDDFNKDPSKYASRFKVINISAKKFTFTPDKITVNRGDVVRIVLTSKDVGHGLKIKEYGVDIHVKGKATGSAEFLADKAGKFNYFCSVFCGIGHMGMKGELTVK